MSEDIAIPRPAATVMLIRDAPELEVLMVQRPARGAFADALVFPGGTVDPHDADPAWMPLVSGAEGLDDAERAWRIAAYRELHEETGLLPGLDPAGAFSDVVRAAPGTLDLSALHPFSHWITPAAARRRFDTRFYLCAHDGSGEAYCAGDELLHAEWMTPAHALALGEAGERLVVFPTRMNLRTLAQSDAVAEAIQAARSRRVVSVTPVWEQRTDGMYLRVPEEAGFGFTEMLVGDQDRLG